VLSSGIDKTKHSLGITETVNVLDALALPLVACTVSVTDFGQFHFHVNVFGILIAIIELPMYRQGTMTTFKTSTGYVLIMVVAS